MNCCKHNIVLYGFTLAVSFAAAFICLPAGEGGWIVPPAAGGEFSIESLELTFDDDSLVRVVSRGDTLQAVADITFSGEGLLSGSWEIAEPTKAAGDPVFRNILIINRNLSASRRVKLRSPSLPTKVTGHYTVRLNIARPPIQGDPHQLRYFVGQQPSEESMGGLTEVPETIAIDSPKDEAAVGRDSPFSWDPVPGSIAYQVELYDRGDSDIGVVPAGSRLARACLIRIPSSLNRPPLLGLMVPGYKTETTLNELTISKLVPEEIYLWRVVALDKGGKVLCESPFQEFRFSQ